jgi:adenosylcobyric acid synthase
MLGHVINDFHGIEGDPGSSEGLGFLDMSTELLQKTVLTRVTGKWLKNNTPIHGYEIHVGQSKTLSKMARLIEIEKGKDPIQWGYITDDGLTWGSYIHGLFDSSVFRRSFLADLSEDYDPVQSRSEEASAD